MDYVKNLRKIIENKPINLVAATAIVVNDKNEILLQKKGFRILD